MPSGHFSEYSGAVRIALVSPYSWTYPGGVTRHIEALADQFIAEGHHVRVLTPADRDSRRTALAHLGARPAARPLPDHVVPLGGTIGWPANGAISNCTPSIAAVGRLRHELRTGDFDVVHVHSPEAPWIGWDAITASPVPTVGTFHAYSSSAFANVGSNLLGMTRHFNKLSARIAVSEAAAWTAQRFWGGRYRIVPNGVWVPDTLEQPADDGVLEIVFVGQVVERKGLPVLLRAFEALRDHVPARLTLVGPTPEEIAPLLLDGRGVEALGKVDDATKSEVLARADLLCAPSLGGESFGMVLTEAFAHGTPVVASDIAGYRDVVSHGVDGLLVERGDATSVAAALRDLALDPARRRRMGEAARENAHRYAWPHVAREVLEVYEQAVAEAPRHASLPMKLGFAPADGHELVLPQRLPSLEPRPARRWTPAAIVRRAALLVVGVAALAGAWFAFQRIGLDAIVQSLATATPTWVLVGFAVMCSSMVLRAVAWHAILRAALPDARVKKRDAMQGTFIGVLMSATLPARLGEPARAAIVARRLGRTRERLPVVLGSIVSQTMLNILALVILGVTMLSTVDLFRNNEALVGVTIAPIAVLICLVVAPAVLRMRGTGGVASALAKVRDGLRVFRSPRLGATAVTFQLSAWALQAVSCWLLLVALGLDDRAGFGAAAAVLFAVNVTAVLPATPSNLGVFQAACVVVLGAYGVGQADALAYGIILQAVEIATAVIMGAPALVKEGVSWREIRLRALHATPVTLAPIERATVPSSG
jgi:phosphatidyl-myo-inositol alpha-mannosyltransferase